MKVCPLQDRDTEKFSALALSCGSIFNTVEWTNLFGKGIRRYGFYNNNDELIGGFITFMEKRAGLTYCRNPYYTPDIGPFLEVKATHPVSVMNTWKRAISLMAETIENLPWHAMSIGLDRRVIDAHPFIWRNCKVIVRYTYVLDLSKTEQDLWKAMASGRRKSISKAIKDGLRVELTEDMFRMKHLILQSFSRQKKAIPEYFLDRILFDFSTHENSFCFITYRGEQPLAGVYCVYDDSTVYYLLGGYDHHNKHHGAGPLAMWSAIQYARGLGRRFFDLEGSSIPAIEQYFRGFGGKLTHVLVINKALFPVEVLLKLLKRSMF